MNFVKKFLKSFFLFLFLLNINNFVFADDFDLSQDSGDSSYMPEDENMEMDAFLENVELNSLKKEPPTAEDILNILVNTVHIEQILQEDLFLRTNPLMKRSLLDNSLFLMDKNYDAGKFVFSVTTPFLEVTTREHFSAPCLAEESGQVNKTASCIQSYLALNSPSLLCKIKDLENKIAEIIEGFDIPDCQKGLSLIKNATVADINLGFFFGLEWYINKFRFRLKTPFYYKLRTMFLTSAERAAIAAEFGGADMSQGLDFARDHIISDQLGFGDLRFEFDYPVAQNSRGAELRLGLFTTIPTAFSVVKGMVGKVYKPITCRPTLDFISLTEELQSEVTRQQAMDKISEIGLAALDNVSSMLLQTNLGNGGHFGLGTKLYNTLPMRTIIDRPWMENCSLKGMASVEYLFSHKETRWFVEKNVKELFDMRDFNDASKAASNLAFLEKMTIDRIFPFVYETKVNPGFIFILEEKFAYEKKKWGWSIGSDVWVNTREKFGEICAPKDQIPLLDIEKARKPWAYQWSFFGSLFFKPKKKKGDLYVGLNAEKVISSRGIGQPFKFSVSLERNF